MLDIRQLQSSFRAELRPVSGQFTYFIVQMEHKILRLVSFGLKGCGTQQKSNFIVERKPFRSISSRADPGLRVTFDFLQSTTRRKENSTFYAFSF